MPYSDFLYVLLIAFGLSADCFTVAIGGSISNKTASVLSVLRVSIVFGLFQAIMPILGWLAGRTVAGFIADYDHWLAFILLILVGGKMIWQSFSTKGTHSENIDISKGFLLFTLALATSIDALAVGLSFAFIEISIVPASLIIGFVAFVLTALGFSLGKKIGHLIGKRAEVIGGVILIGIGFQILLSHI
jgi:putative Mn2+ efflux pump MntP